MTENYSILKKYRESEKRYKAIVQDLPDFVVRWKEGGVRTFVNEAYCERFNTTLEDAIGTSFYDLIPDEARAEVLHRQASLSWNNPKVVTTHKVVHEDGTEGWERWTERAFFDENRNIIEYQSVGTDVTSLVSIKDELDEQRKELEKLIDNIPGLVYRHQVWMNIGR